MDKGSAKYRMCNVIQFHIHRTFARKTDKTLFFGQVESTFCTFKETKHFYCVLTTCNSK